MIQNPWLLLGGGCYLEGCYWEGGSSIFDRKSVFWYIFRNGYVTAYSEDMCIVGTFQYRMLGFKNQPTDHIGRTYNLVAEQMTKTQPRLCMGSLPRHRIFMDWFR